MRRWVDRGGEICAARPLTGLREGLPELWLVDTVADAVFALRRLTADSVSFDIAQDLSRSEELTSPQLPGFRIRVSELFPGERECP